MPSLPAQSCAKKMINALRNSPQGVLRKKLGFMEQLGFAAAPCLSLWERCPSAYTGAERATTHPQSRRKTPSQSKIGSKEPIFASSPRGRAKSAYGAKQLAKLKFEEFESCKQKALTLMSQRLCYPFYSSQLCQTFCTSSSSSMMSMSFSISLTCSSLSSF